MRANDDTARERHATRASGAVPLVRLERDERDHRLITLSDPARRNALSHAMFDALDRALAEAGSAPPKAHSPPAASPEGASILRLRGAGPSFCAGFDLEACTGTDGQRVLASFLERLSTTIRALRRGPWVVVAEVRGAALAGGCALLTACDFVVVADNAQLGYPVHRIGLSPAVTTPLLSLAMGDGAARALLLSGEIIGGGEALRRGLATHSVAEAEVAPTVDALCARLIEKGPIALLTTRRWIDRMMELDRDERFDQALSASLANCGSEESVRMLTAFWQARRAR